MNQQPTTENAPPIPKSFASRAASQKTRFYGLTYTPQGRPQEYYYLLVDPLKEKAFLRALDGQDAFALREYGVIVASGFGEPSDALKQEMREKYNANI